jgi:hypothetical protein
MSELLTVPRIVIGNRQLRPGATLMSPVEFSPQSASSTNFGQSEAASAKDAYIEPVAPTPSANFGQPHSGLPRSHAAPLPSESDPGAAGSR